MKSTQQPVSGFREKREPWGRGLVTSPLEHKQGVPLMLPCFKRKWGFFTSQFRFRSKTRKERSISCGVRVLESGRFAILCGVVNTA